MGLIQESHKKVIRKKLNDLKEQVSIVYFTQEMECAFCRETREMLEEVTALSDKLRLQVYDFQRDKGEAEKYRIDKIPATVIQNGKDYGIRFYGVPAGYEFATLLEDFMMVSHGDSGLSRQSREALKLIQAPAHIQVFVTPT